LIDWLNLSAILRRFPLYDTTEDQARDTLIADDIECSTYILSDIDIPLIDRHELRCKLLTDDLGTLRDDDTSERESEIFDIIIFLLWKMSQKCRCPHECITIFRRDISICDRWIIVKKYIWYYDISDLMDEIDRTPDEWKVESIWEV
jgi:hypothetical protein